MFWNRIVLIFKKWMGSYTARPKVINIGEGTVTFRDIPKETWAPLVDLINAYMANPTGTVAIGEPAMVAGGFNLVELPQYQIAQEALNVSQLTDLALGVTKDNAGNYHLVEVVYNKDSREAQVLSSRDCGKDKYIVFGDFKMKAAKSILNH